MKPPKNFYSNLDRRKQGLPEVPEASATDAGRALIVSESGSYELGSIEALPAVTSADEGKVLMVNDQGEWVAAPFSPGAEVSPLNYFQLPRGNSNIMLGFKPTDCDEIIIDYHTMWSSSHSQLRSGAWATMMQWRIARYDTSLRV